jgi:sulfatase maturation enzyme AslB (radical SAM superfamily)
MADLFISLPESNLPIFYLEGERDVLFYTPGYLVRVEKQNWRQTIRMSDAWRQLERKAIKALEKPSLRTSEFKPLSLNVYLNRHCNLECIYCFTKSTHKNKPLMALSTDAIIAAAQIVIKNCKEMNKPMVLVMHGGGEPTLDNRLEPLVNYIKDVCSKEDVEIFTYLATNGVMTPAKAEKICQLFDLIGLSCDGPPNIQNMHRPLEDKANSSAYIERTVSILHRHFQAFEVRVTLTKNSWPQMMDIAQYLIDHIHPDGINVELAYLTATPLITANDINTFTELYLSAQAHCQAAGIPWRGSAIRPSQHHQQYCHVLQDTFQIIPGDVATNCFLDNDSIESKGRGLQISAFDKQTKKWTFDFKKIHSLRTRLITNVQICEDCIVSSHCHRSCPNICPFDNHSTLPDILCQLNQHLFNKVLIRAGDELSEYCEQHSQLIHSKDIIAC